MEGIRSEAIKITNAVKTRLINRFVSQPAFVKALSPETTEINFQEEEKVIY